MRGGRAYLGLAVVMLALLGAFLHPLAFLASFLPFDSRGFLTSLNGIKSLIFDGLAWAAVGFLLLMALQVWRGRVQSGRPVTRRYQVRMPIPQTKVVVAVTAYNDAAATAATVRAFKAQRNVAEVLVVDNNSTDGTAELAIDAGARVIPEARQGYGYACMRGLSEACRIPGVDVVVLVEGDGTFVGADLPKFLAYISQADMVVGTRIVRNLVEPGSQMDYFFTWGNIAVAYLLRLRFWDSQFLGVASLTDVGCTYRAIKRDALERILPDLCVGGNHFSLHMMLVALHHRLTLLEIPITFRKRVGRSKGASQSLRKGFGVGMAMIWHILTFQPTSRGLALSPKAREHEVEPEAAEERTLQEVAAGLAATKR